MPPKPSPLIHRSALNFVIIIGVISLFADMTYEGARSISGPYLALLGANALTVSFVSGFGELVGYGLRLASGYIADKSGRYWAITILGYICNLLAVPLLAFSGHWWSAASLLIIERLGKAIRTPTRDAMLSHAASQTGLGWGFGLHEALDQLGALLGPLIVAAVLFYRHSYKEAFAILFIPALTAIILLYCAKYFYPHPHELEAQKTDLEISKLNGKAFWLYLIGACFIAIGFADFPLIAFHFAKANIMSAVWIPIIYSFAMGIDGLAALGLGYLYDKSGFGILIVITLVTCLFAPLVFLGSISVVFIGIALWSIGVGAHESLMRAIVAKLIPINKRASAYGIFNMSYGIAWFLGSLALGSLYDISLINLVIFSVCSQLISIPFLWKARSYIKTT